MFDLIYRKTYIEIVSLLRCDLGLEMSSPHLEVQSSRIKSPSKRCFVLCQRCYWCVSCFGKWNISRCPCCGNIGLDSIPIPHNECCKFAG